MVSPNPISPPYVTGVTVTCVFTFLAGVAIVLRYLSRRLSTLWKMDDWIIVGAYVNDLGTLVLNVVSATLGMAGYPITEIDDTHLALYEKTALAYNILYTNSVILAKISIVLMYRRIFQTPTFLLWTWPVFILLAMYWIVLFFVELFAYSPVRAQWDPKVKGTHVDLYPFDLVMASWNMVMDILILSMPQVQIWHLQMSLRKRALVSVVFLFGAMVCVASIVRLVYFTRINYADPTVTLSDASIWTTVELNMAIICACLPTFPGIFHHWFGRKKEKGPNHVSFWMRYRTVHARYIPGRGDGETWVEHVGNSSGSTLGPGNSRQQPQIMHSTSQDDGTEVYSETKYQNGIRVKRDVAISDSKHEESSNA